VKTLGLFAVLSATVALLGCAAPTTERFTLRSAEGPSASATTKATVGAARVMTVEVRAPDALDRPTWLVRGEGPAVATFQQVRWPQPLSIEVADALAQRLDRALQPEINVVSAIATGPGPRVDVRVVSFDMWLVPAPRVFDEFLWEIQCAAAAGAPRRVVTGRTRYVGQVERAEAAAAPAWAALAAEHSKALDRLSEDVLAHWRQASANSGGC
jgi:uncharacterized lipoprotein YmbA